MAQTRSPCKRKRGDPTPRQPPKKVLQNKKKKIEKETDPSTSKNKESDALDSINEKKGSVHKGSDIDSESDSTAVDNNIKSSPKKKEKDKSFHQQK